LNPTEPLLELIDVRAGYAQPVVGPVSFAIHAGEVVGLTGVNGVGKTTLLNLVTGSARLFGGELRRSPGLTLVYHRQRPEKPPELPITGLEVLRIARARTAGLPAGVAALCDACLDEMSGGEFQLLHAWACLMGPAQLVLLDEPTNNLDQAAIELLLAELQELSPGRAVLIVSHESAFLDAACDRTLPLCR
jgi:ATPase subunit of ABC transporter with duplicated ATPase domains